MATLGTRYNNVYCIVYVCVFFFSLSFDRSTLMCDEVDWLVYLFFSVGLLKWERKKPLKDVPMQVHGLHKRRNSDQFTLNSEVYRLCKFARPAKQREFILPNQKLQFVFVFFFINFLSSEFFFYFRFVSK